VTPRNLILTGIPRTGTSLCCTLLGQADDTVALCEPMPVHELPLSPPEAVETIQAYFDNARIRLLQTGTAFSMQTDGQLPDNTMADRPDVGGLRGSSARVGLIRISKPLSPTFTLIIKHPAAFTALLPALTPVFECCALVRNPLSVLLSWHSLNIPISMGRAPAGERLDPVLTARLNAQPDVISRQLCLLDWFFERFERCLPRERIVHYEHMMASHGASLSQATAVPIPSVPLHSRNTNRLYDRQACERYAQALCRHDGAWQQFYSNADVMRTLDALLQ